MKIIDELHDGSIETTVVDTGVETQLLSVWCETCGEQLEIGRWEIGGTRERLFVIPCKKCNITDSE